MEQVVDAMPAIRPVYSAVVRLRRLLDDRSEIAEESSQVYQYA